MSRLGVMDIDDMVEMKEGELEEERDEDTQGNNCYIYTITNLFIVSNWILFHRTFTQCDSKFIVPALIITLHTHIVFAKDI